MPCWVVYACANKNCLGWVPEHGMLCQFCKHRRDTDNQKLINDIIELAAKLTDGSNGADTK